MTSTPIRESSGNSTGKAASNPKGWKVVRQRSRQQVWIETAFSLLHPSYQQGISIPLGAELAKFGGKFDDLIFVKDYHDQNQSFLYLQAKHKYEKPKSDKSSKKTISIASVDLLDDNKGNFSLTKYFHSYRYMTRHCVQLATYLNSYLNARARLFRESRTTGLNRT